MNSPSACAYLYRMSYLSYQREDIGQIRHRMANIKDILLIYIKPSLETSSPS
jgi:hypothetical protein